MCSYFRLMEVLCKIVFYVLQRSFQEADFMMIIPREDLSCFRIQLVDFAPIHWPRDKLVMLILREGSCSLMPDKDGLLLLA